MRWHFANRHKTSSSLKGTTPLYIFTEGGVATRRLEIRRAYISVLKSQKATQECYIKRAYKYVGREGAVVGRMITVDLNNRGGVFKIDL